jgi:hypothetical protein
MASCDIVVIAIPATPNLFAFLGISDIVFVLLPRRRVQRESSSGRQHIEHSSSRDFTEHYLCLP